MAGNKNSGRRRTWTSNKKPKPVRVIVDGNARFIGVTAAAAYLGCTPSALSAVLRNVPARGERLRDKAKKHFPELFTETENETKQNQ